MKVLVIGDSCIDRFIYCSINRLCPEAPVPVLQPINSITSKGMSYNVSNNLKSLGADVTIVTNTDNQPIKTRYVDNKSGQMIMRLDENDKCNPCDVTKIKFNYDAIIISDYNKGFLNTSDIEFCLTTAKCPTFIDTKKILDKFVYNASFIKINKPEMDLNTNYKQNNIIVTDGPNGATYKNQHYPVKNKVIVSDVSGAGDTFLAGLVYKYIQTNNINKSINFANECASKVVQQRGVTIV